MITIASKSKTAKSFVDSCLLCTTSRCYVDLLLLESQVAQAPLGTVNRMTLHNSVNLLQEFVCGDIAIVKTEIAQIREQNKKIDLPVLLCVKPFMEFRGFQSDFSGF